MHCVAEFCPAMYYEASENHFCCTMRTWRNITSHRVTETSTIIQSERLFLTSLVEYVFLKQFGLVELLCVVKPYVWGIKRLHRKLPCDTETGIDMAIGGVGLSQSTSQVRPHSRAANPPLSKRLALLSTPS